MSEPVRELEEEQAGLETVLRPLSEGQWRLRTPAAGWDVRDQVSHLADTEELAYDCVAGGPRQINEEGPRYPTPEAYTQSMCDKGRAMAPSEVLAWWTTGAARTRAALERLDPKARVPWGLGMSARAFAAARLMEHWAHGLDIRAAVDAPIPFGERHRSVAWLIYRSLPYAFSVSGRDQPPGELRVELDFYLGRWEFGPPEADSRIEGDALEFCRVGVQRMSRDEATTLKAHGALAEEFLDVARAFL
jgi:uncharacterized protein (TIGR03084 family)